MKVYLLSRPQINWTALTEFLADEGKPDVLLPVPEANAETLVEVAGRLCYMSFSKGRKTNQEFIDNIQAHGHGSVLEHANWSLLITGVSRSLTHELVRHRHFSYSQLSQRYVDEQDVAFVMPPAIQDASVATQQTYERAITAAKTAYSMLSAELGIKHASINDPLARVKKTREAARCVLPNATETKIVITGNARAFRHFLEMRGSVFADPEIRNLAGMVLNIMQVEAPNIFADFEKLSDGSLVNRYKKV
jgi:thymidylate synthase (FAD)